MEDNKYNKEIKVLDHGLVRLVDYMGTDAAIVQAARVSYGDGTKTVKQDRGLIRYLMRHRHTSPMEMCTIKFHIKAPIFVARQWVRHRTANWSEISGRYSVMPKEFYLPDENRLKIQSTDSKQGSAEETIEFPGMIQTIMKSDQVNTYSNYEKYQKSGLAREIARVNLPNSLYTEFYWQMNLHNLFHFLKLRMDPHAQYEMREYANVIYDIIKPLFPLACEAFEDYILNGANLSATELDILKFLIKEDQLNTKLSDDFNLSDEEYKEFLNKLKR